MRRSEQGEKPIDQDAETVIQLLTSEHLAVPHFETIEQLARRCVSAADVQALTIDGLGPRNYRPLQEAV